MLQLSGVQNACVRNVSSSPSLALCMPFTIKWIKGEISIQMAINLIKGKCFMTFIN